MDKIVLASNNAGKIKEFRHIFANLGIELISQSELNIAEIDEPYYTFVENSLHKARHCAKHSGLAALADDSGICVNSLNGRPGVFSARYAGEPKSDLRNNQKLVAELRQFSDKSAYFYCVLVLVRHELDPQPLIADGFVHGQIVDLAKGEDGFGYDPHFYLPNLGKTVGELSFAEKNKISHRRMATNTLLTRIRDKEIG